MRERWRRRVGWVHAALIAVVGVLCTACGSTPAPMPAVRAPVTQPSDPPTIDAGTPDAVPTVPTADAAPANIRVVDAAVPGPSPDDFCADFNRGESLRRRGNHGTCPYCPCACVGGKISCAPCVLCVEPVRPDTGIGPVPKPLLKLPPKLTPQPLPSP